MELTFSIFFEIFHVYGLVATGLSDCGTHYYGMAVWICKITPFSIHPNIQQLRCIFNFFYYTPAIHWRFFGLGLSFIGYLLIEIHFKNGERLILDSEFHLRKTLTALLLVIWGPETEFLILSILKFEHLRVHSIKNPKNPNFKGQFFLDYAVRPQGPVFVVWKWFHRGQE
jgi:hypothetical protein